MSETVAEAVKTPTGAAAHMNKTSVGNPFEATSRNILGNTSVANVAQSFDRSQHQPFRLDHRGFNKDYTLDERAKLTALGTEMMASKFSNTEEAKIPNWWQRGEKTNPHRTNTDLQANRRREFIPDISFDLDGDGIVGNRDLVIAKLFDKDGDGRLNTGERSNAMDAIRNVSSLLHN